MTTSTQDLVRVAVIAVAAALVLTKLLDVLSTLRVVAMPRQESNPLAARLMRGVGVRRAVWLVFAVSCAIIATCAWAALNGPVEVAVAFCLVGLGVAYLQLCVARANDRGRLDAVTRLVFRVHRRLGRLHALLLMWLRSA